MSDINQRLDIVLRQHILVAESFDALGTLAQTCFPILLNLTRHECATLASMATIFEQTETSLARYLKVLVEYEYIEQTIDGQYRVLESTKVIIGDILGTLV